MKLILALGILALVAGCQSTAKIEYYEPTEANQAYCVTASGNQSGRGPIKSIEGKRGVPSGESTTFALDFSLINF